MSSMAVQLHILDDQVVLYNGLLQLKLTKPGGDIIEIQYNGIDNLLELHNPLNPELNGGFWDLNWSESESTQTRGKFDTIEGTAFEIIVQNDEQVELSFKRIWDSPFKDEHAPLNIDKRFIMLRGSSGFYSYAIYEHLENMPSLNLNETRMVFMLKKEKFHYMAVADNRQRFMPLPDDRLPGRGQELAYPEAVLLVNPVEPEFLGEVDDKYQYMCENKDNKVHGWICLDPPVGFWQITPSNEFRTCGPLKQDLTSHVWPVTLAMFVSAHYGGLDVVLNFKAGEIWKKVFGPVFIYLNSNLDKDKLWNDAKEQMKTEVESWPYHFPLSEDFLHSDQRGSVSGTLLVDDKYISDHHILAVGAHVGLAPPGEVGSFQREGKGYQFWTNTNDEGHFCIKNIRPGNYNLYAFVPGFIGDYRYEKLITVTPDSSINIGKLLYKPPRDGPTLWEIGTPDRSAAEFYVPEPDPKYINKLYINHPDRFRQYGLWDRYTDLYPDKDLVYLVGVSDYRKDWFYAQVTRKTGDGKYIGTTWQIKFKVQNVDKTGTYKLRVALASVNMSILEIRVNDEEEKPPRFSSGLIGKDNAIARHGIHGLYWLFRVDIYGGGIVEGENTIFLTQPNSNNDNSNGFPFGLMYDYIRLEAPPPTLL